MPTDDVPTERAPLLAPGTHGNRNSTAANDRTYTSNGDVAGVSGDDPVKDHAKTRLGPLEISKRRRNMILVGEHSLCTHKLRLNPNKIGVFPLSVRKLWFAC